MLHSGDVTSSNLEICARKEKFRRLLLLEEWHLLNYPHIWWTGPYWLRQSSSTWPQLSTSEKNNFEERSARISVITSVQSSKLWNLLNKYSTLTRLWRATALCLRVASRFKGLSDSLVTDPITIHELKTAKFYWVKVIQQSSFQLEFILISKGIAWPTHKSNPLLRFTPFVDCNELLRIAGCLQSSLLPSTAQVSIDSSKEINTNFTCSRRPILTYAPLWYSSYISIHSKWVLDYWWTSSYTIIHFKICVTHPISTKKNATNNGSASSRQSNAISPFVTFWDWLCQIVPS